MPKVRGFDRDSQNLINLNKLFDFGGTTRRDRMQIRGKFQEKRESERFTWIWDCEDIFAE